MLYPVYVHHEEGSAYGAIVPDFEGCFAAADSLRDLPAAVQEAAEALFEGKEAGIPCLLYTSPSPRDRTRSRMPSSA